VLASRSSNRASSHSGNAATRVGLEVDSENATGATRLYERAGFHVTRSYATYEKALTGVLESGEQESNPHLRQGLPPS
jgi:ribosomal protein S18 acetylase RimI-like enzyme